MTFILGQHALEGLPQGAGQPAGILHGEPVAVGDAVQLAARGELFDHFAPEAIVRRGAEHLDDPVPGVQPRGGGADPLQGLALQFAVVDHPGRPHAAHQRGGAGLAGQQAAHHVGRLRVPAVLGQQVEGMQPGEAVVAVQLEGLEEGRQCIGLAFGHQQGMATEAMGDGLARFQADHLVGGSQVGLGVAAVVVQVGQLAPAVVGIRVHPQQCVEFGLGALAVVVAQAHAGAVERQFHRWRAAPAGRLEQGIQLVLTAAFQQQAGQLVVGAPVPGGELQGAAQGLFAGFVSAFLLGQGQPGVAVAGTPFHQAAGQGEGPLGLVQRGAVAAQLVPGPAVAGLVEQDALGLVGTGGHLAALAQHVAEPGAQVGVVGGALEHAAQHGFGLVEAGALLHQGFHVEAHALGPQRVDPQAVAQGLAALGVAALVTQQQGALQAQARHLAEAFLGTGQQGVGLVGAFEEGQLAGGDHPQLPGVRLALQGGLELLQQRGIVQQGAGLVGVGEPAVAEVHLLHQLGVDVGQGFVQFLAAGAAVQQHAQGVVVVDAAGQRQAEGLAGGLATAGLQVHEAEGGLGAGGAVLHLDGPLAGLQGFVVAPEAGQGHGQFADRPGVLGVAGQQAQQGGLGVFQGAPLGPLHGQVGDAPVMGEARHQGFDVGVHGLFAGALQQQVHLQAVHAHVQRVQFGGFAAPGLGLFEVTAGALAVQHGGTQPVAAPADRFGAFEQGLVQLQFADAPVEVGQAEQQRGVARALFDGLLQDLAALPGEVQLLQAFGEGQARAGVQAAQACLPATQEGQALLLPAEEAQGAEVLDAEAFVGVVQAGGDAVVVAGRLALAGAPQLAGQFVPGQGVGRCLAQDAGQQAAGLGGVAAVLAEDAGVAHQQHGVAPAFLAVLGEPVEVDFAAFQLGQRGGLGEDQVGVFGEALQQRLGGFQHLALAAVVPAEGAQALVGQAVLGRGLAQGLEGGLGLFAVVHFQGADQAVVVIPHVAFGQFQPVQPVGFLGGQQEHAARAGGALALQQADGEGFAEVGLAGVADQQGATGFVVAHHGLQVAAAGVLQGQGEGDAAVDQGTAGGPVHGELTGQPAVALAPSALGLVGGAVVADLLGHFEVADGAAPVTGQRGEGGRYAGHVVLADEAHRQQAAPALGLGEVLGDLAVERRLRLQGQAMPGGQVAAQAGDVAPAGGVPAAHALLHQRRQLFAMGQPVLSLVEGFAFDQQVGELGTQAGALAARTIGPQARQSSVLAAELQFQLRGLVLGAAVVGAFGEHGFAEGQGFFVAVLLLQAVGALHRQPRVAGQQALGFGVAFGAAVEVTQQRVQVTEEGQPFGAQLGRLGQPAVEPLDEAPGAVLPATREQEARIAQACLGGFGVAAEGAPGQGVGQARRAHVADQAAGQRQGGGVAPLAVVTQAAGQGMGLEEQATVGQRLDGVQQLGALVGG